MLYYPHKQVRSVFTPHRSYGLNRRTCSRGKYGFCSDFIDIINAMGGTVVEYKYDAWGNILSVTGSMASTLGAVNPFRYCGYYYDTESGFYYLQSRYYDPQVGRFLNADGIIGANGGIMGYNMFAYCNNPVMYMDPGGMMMFITLTETMPGMLHTMFASMGFGGGVAIVCTGGGWSNPYIFGPKTDKVLGVLITTINEAYDAAKKVKSIPNIVYVGRFF